jgi:uncharacterized membrane protein YoaK (UPF0700 family)
MPTFLAEIRDTLLPGRGSKDGPLPPLLVGMTLVTGLVDAYSYLVLGHVFVANMTGNVVFLGFALAGAPGFSIGASAAAMASFSAGALVGGSIARRTAADRGALLGSSTLIQVMLVGVAVALAWLGGNHVTPGYRYGLIGMLALAMGLQNAAVRKLAVADLTTTVLTLTMTGLVADSSLVGGTGSKAGRRLVAVSAMFLGALLGAALVIHSRAAITLSLGLGVLLAIAATTLILVRSGPAWAQGMTGVTRGTPT